MKRRRWRRSTEAKPDEIWTQSNFHMAGLLVHAVTGIQKTNLRFNTDTDAVPFVL